MAGLNRVMLIARLGRDPEMKYTQQGTAICNMTIATSESWTDKSTGEKQEKTEWHRCVSFGKQAEVLGKYLVKGSKVYIDGKLQTRQYEKDGQTHYATEIVVHEFTFLGGGKQSSGGSQNAVRGNKPSTGQQSQGRQQPQNNQNNGYDDGSGSIPF
jgi:single-strand DNA-binding protein